LHMWYIDMTYIFVTWLLFSHYGVATISRLLKIIGLFCKRALLKMLYSAKETYNFKEPTNRSHPIGGTKLLTLANVIWGGYGQ